MAQARTKNKSPQGRYLAGAFEPLINRCGFYRGCERQRPLAALFKVLRFQRLHCSIYRLLPRLVTCISVAKLEPTAQSFRPKAGATATP